MKKYIVTGGAGFIASHLTDQLIEDGNEVLVIDNLSTGKKGNVNPKAVFHEIDIQSSKISGIFGSFRPDAVFHYAAQIDIRKSVADPAESARNNILGTLNILENCKNSGVKKVIFSSTGGAIYGETDIVPTLESCPTNPLSPYGIEKLAAEKYLDFYKKEYGVDYLVFRFANVYGPRQNSKGEAGVVAIFFDKILNGEKIIINGDGKQTRDFIYVQDIVGANILAMQKNQSGIFNLGTGIETDVNTIFSKIKNILGSNVEEIHGVKKAGEQMRSCLDYNKAKEAFGWAPQWDLDRGLKEINQ